MATTTTLENITATTDTKVFIAGESTAKTKADFEALTWTEIGGITNLDEVGDEREEITVEVYGAGRRLKRAGIRDAGTLALEVARDVFDGGQTIARDGFEGGKPHAFKIVLDDRPTGTTGKPTTIYCLGVILSARVVFGGPNEIVKQTFNTSLTDKPLEIPASAI